MLYPEGPGERVKLELRRITKRFPGVLANDAISLDMRDGEILGLLGENGAGKTTLMNILYGLYHPDAGEILIDDRPVRFPTPETLSRPASEWSISTSCSCRSSASRRT